MRNRTSLISGTRLLKLVGTILCLYCMLFSTDNLFSHYKDKPIKIVDSWQYRWAKPLFQEDKKNGTVPKWISESFTGSDWQNYKAFEIPSGRKKNEVLWLRVKLPERSWEIPALILIHHGNNLRAYLDDELIKEIEMHGADGEIVEGKAWPFVHLDEDYGGKTLTLEVDGRARDYAEILAGVFIGSYTDLLYFAIFSEFWSFFLGIFLICLSIFVALSYRKQFERSSLVLAFSFFAVCTGIFIISGNTSFWMFLYPYLPKDKVFVLLWYLSIYILPVSYGLFIEQVFGKGYKGINRKVWQIHLLFAVGVLIWGIVFGFTWHWKKTITVFFVLLTFTIITSLIMVFKYAIKGDKETRIFAVGIGTLGLTAIHDILNVFQFVCSDWWLFNFGTFIFIVALSSILPHRFNEAKARLKAYSEELKNYSENLEIIVEERTEKLKESEEFFRLITEYSSDVIMKHTPLPEGRILFASPSCGSICGYEAEDLVDRSLADYIHPEDFKQIKEGNLLRESQGIFRVTCRIKHKDGGYIWIETISREMSKNSSAEVLELLSVSRDITERKEAEMALQEKNDKLEESLKQIREMQNQIIMQEKMASLGSLTAGIAHEIKNPLNFVNNFSRFSLDLIGDLKDIKNSQKSKLDIQVIENFDDTLSDLERYAYKINEHGQRADNIVKGMLLHSRGKAGEARLTDINELLEEYVNLAYHGMRARESSFNISLEKSYDSSLDKISIIPQDIGRVFLNIINNACYTTHEKKLAINGDYKPTLSLISKNKSNCVEIEIRDNGKGISQNIQNKIFTPFFTTKPAGTGIGLGLSISYEIIVQTHQGEIKVESQEGVYSSFIIIIPKRTTEVRDEVGSVERKSIH